MLKSLVTTSLTLAIFCAVSATLVKAAPAPEPAPSAAAQAGQQVFLKNCFACHSTNEGQQKVGPSLYGEIRGAHPKRTVTEARDIIENGRKGSIGQMLAFKDILSKEDTDNLLAYLRTL